MITQREGATVVNGISEAKNRRRAKEDEDVDQGLAWAVLVASFIVNVISLGTNFSLGVYYAEFLDVFERSATETALLIGLSCALVLCAGPFAGIMANRFGARILIICGGILTASGFLLSAFVRDFPVLFVTFGFMTGFGSGLSYTPSFGVLPLYFVRRRNFATAIVTAGNGLGILVFPILFRYLIDTYTWRGAMFIQAGIALNVLPCGAIIFKRQPRSEDPKGRLAALLDFTLFREPGFYYSLSHFFLMGSIYIFSVLCIRFAIDKTGVSKNLAPLLLSINGATNTGGRAISAILSNSRFATSTVRFIVFHIFSIAVAVCCGVYALCETFTAVCVVAGLVGLAWGTKFALVPGLTLDLLGGKRFNAAWGYLVFVLGIAFLVFPPLGTKIGEITGSMEDGFFFGGAISSIALIFGFLIHYETRRLHRKSLKSSESPATLTIVRHNQKPFDEN